MKTSERISRIKPSATLVITARAKKLKREGKDVTSFGAGEPDFNTPEHICEAARRAIVDGHTKYTPSDGIPELKEAVAEVTKKDFGYDAQSENVIVTCGGKQALYNLCLAILNPGDEVIIPAPYWVSYPEMVKLGEGKPVIINTAPENNFCLSAAELERAITPRTKALILNSPSNPTGAAYTRENLADLGRVLKDRDILVICDDIYHKLVYDGFEYNHLYQVVPEISDRIFFVNGVAKSYAMTGWRIGWAVGDKDIVAGMKKISAQSTSCPASVSQYAALAALTGDQSCCAEMLEAFAARRELIINLLNEIDSVSCINPQGAFYAFVSVKELIGRKFGDKIIEDDVALAEILLEDKLVAAVPGTAFGAPGYIRFSYATGESTIKEGMKRFKNFVDNL